MARHFQSPFRRSTHCSRPQRPQINLNKGGFLRIKNHRRGSQPCWDMNWNEHPRIHGVTRRQLQQKWSYPAATAALMELCSARTTNSALSALQRPGNSKNAAFAAHNSIFVALGENAQMGGLRQSARGSRSRRSSASMAPSIDARPTHSARSPQSMRAAPLGMSPTAQRSPRETARVERPNRCHLTDLSTFGRSMGIKRSRRKSASVPTCAFPAHRAAPTPTLPV